MNVYGLRRPLALLSVIQAAAEHSESWMAMAVHAVLGWSHEQSGRADGAHSSPVADGEVCSSSRHWPSRVQLAAAAKAVSRGFSSRPPLSMASLGWKCQCMPCSVGVTSSQGVLVRCMLALWQTEGPEDRRAIELYTYSSCQRPTMSVAFVAAVIR